MTRAEAEALFLQHLATIDRIVRAACARNRFDAAEIEDVASSLRLKLIENDYAAVRGFEGKCAFSTYITIVIQRFLIDERNRRWGRWTSSAEAERQGAVAVEIEALLHRDGRSFEEVCRIMSAKPEPLSAAAVDAIVATLPRRLPRPSTRSIEDDNVAATVATGDGPHARFLAREREQIGRVASDALNATIRALSAEDRLLLRMRFEDAMSVAHIARALGEDQRRLYYRIEKLAAALRRTLEQAGVDREAARDLLAAGAGTLSLELPGNPDGNPSNERNRENRPAGTAHLQ
jgi:RNA polymerase sigma factor (sigma-70 family)